MKQSLQLVIISVLISFGALGQTESILDSTNGRYYVAKHVDDMTNSVFYSSSEPLICLNEGRTKRFSLSYVIEGRKDSAIKITGLSAKILGLHCLEKGTELLILFDDTTSQSFESMSKFNCEGQAEFRLSPSQVKEVGSKPINKIRFKNGKGSKSFTHELVGEDKKYLLNMFKSVERRDIRVRR
jgi:hypothetical protein